MKVIILAAVVAQCCGLSLQPTVTIDKKRVSATERSLDPSNDVIPKVASSFAQEDERDTCCADFVHDLGSFALFSVPHDVYIGFLVYLKDQDVLDGHDEQTFALSIFFFTIAAVSVLANLYFYVDVCDGGQGGLRGPFHGFLCMQTLGTASELAIFSFIGTFLYSLEKTIKSRNYSRQ